MEFWVEIKFVKYDELLKRLIKSETIVLLQKYIINFVVNTE